MQKRKNNTFILIIGVFLGLCLTIFTVYNTYSKYKLTKIYIEAEAEFIGTDHCDENLCVLKYKYLGNQIYETSYRTTKKPHLKSSETIYYNPNNIKKSFLKNELFNFPLIIGSLLFLIVPLIILVGKNMKYAIISRLFVDIIIIGMSIFFIFLNNLFIQLLGINILIVFTLITISKKISNNKIKEIFGSILLLSLGSIPLSMCFLEVFNILYFIIGLIFVFLGLATLHSKSINSSDEIIETNTLPIADSLNNFNDKKNKLHNIILKILLIIFTIIDLLIILFYFILVLKDPSNIDQIANVMVILIFPMIPTLLLANALKNKKFMLVLFSKN